MPRRRDTINQIERRNVSLPRVVSEAADVIAAEEGRKFSQLVAELIRERAVRLFGPNWREQIEQERAA